MWPILQPKNTLVDYSQYYQLTNITTGADTILHFNEYFGERTQDASLNNGYIAPRFDSPGYAVMHLEGSFVVNAIRVLERE